MGREGSPREQAGCRNKADDGRGAGWHACVRWGLLRKARPACADAYPAARSHSLPLPTPASMSLTLRTDDSSPRAAVLPDGSGTAELPAGHLLPRPPRAGSLHPRTVQRHAESARVLGAARQVSATLHARACAPPHAGGVPRNPSGAKGEPASWSAALAESPPHGCMLAARARMPPSRCKCDAPPGCQSQVAHLRAGSPSTWRTSPARRAA